MNDYTIAAGKELGLKRDLVPFVKLYYVIYC